MFSAYTIPGEVLHFNRWSRKGYAALLSLGKVVNIGHLNAEVADSSLSKNDRNNVCNLADCYGNSYDDEDNLFEETAIDLLSVLQVELQYSVSKSIPHSCRYSIAGIFLSGFRSIFFLFNSVRNSLTANTHYYD